MARPLGLATFRPEPPNLAEIDPTGIRIDYDEPTDTLFIHLRSDRRPAVSVTTGEHIYVRVDPGTNETIGLMIEEFLTLIVIEHPELLDMAVRAEALTPEQTAAARKRVPPDREKQIFVRSVLELATT